MFGNLFKPQQPQQTQANQSQPQQPAVAGPQQPTQQAGSSNPASQPQNPAGNQSQNFPQNPVDIYASLFDNNKQQQQDAPPTFNIDSEALNKVSSGLKFTEGLDQNLVQQALQGDPQAFMQVLNAVGQNAYKTSLQHGGVLADKFIGARSEYDRKAVSGEVKQQLISSNFNVPNASHPVVKQELRRIADMMHKQNPDASPQEIAQAAQEYFTNLSQAISQPQQSAQAKAEEAEVDWDKHFS